MADSGKVLAVECFYRSEGNTGFGQATFEMRGLLREAGLEMTGENNQYVDHMGIELLLLSVLLQRAAAGEGAMETASDFARTHPTGWVGELRARVQDAAPDGYIAHLLGLAESLLNLVAS